MFVLKYFELIIRLVLASRVHSEFSPSGWFILCPNMSVF